MKKLAKFIPTLLFFFFTLAPFLAYAQRRPNQSMRTGILVQCPDGLSGVVCRIGGVLSWAIPVLIALGLVYFVWGVVMYVIADGEEAKKAGKDRMIFGIIGLAVIIGVWGLVAILNQTFGLGGVSGLDGEGAPNVTKLVTTPAADTCQYSSTKPKFQDILNYATCIIGRSVIPFIFAIAMVSFIWGAVKFFIIESDEEAKRAQGKQFMLWGIIALAVMVSVWGLVRILGATVDINTTVLPSVAPSN